jgi:hypothetical protein
MYTNKKRRKHQLCPAITEEIYRIAEQYVYHCVIVKRHHGTTAALRRRHVLHSGTRAIDKPDIPRHNATLAVTADDGWCHRLTANRMHQLDRVRQMLSRPETVETPEHEGRWKQVVPHIGQTVYVSPPITSANLLEAADADKAG